MSPAIEKPPAQFTVSRPGARKVKDGKEYRTQIKTVPASPPGLKWKLLEKPKGMKIGAGGRINWQAKWQEDPIPVQVEAKSAGQRAVIAWEIQVEPIKPRIQKIPNATVDDGASYEVTPKLVRGTEVSWLPVATHDDYPTHMRVDTKTGKMTWKAAYSSRYPTRVAKIQAVGPGGTAEVRWRIKVRPLPPKLKKIRDGKVQDGELYQLEPKRPELEQGSGEIRWELTEKPDGMTVDEATGQIQWQAVYSKEPVAVALQATGDVGADVAKWKIGVEGKPPKLQKLENADLKVDEVYWPTAKLTQGSGVVTLKLSGAPPGMTVQPATNKLLWIARPMSSPVKLALEATGVDSETDKVEWKLTVQEEEPPPASSCEPPTQEAQLCCDPTLEIVCGHVDSDEKDIRKSPRGYTMKLPPKGAGKPNEKPFASLSEKDRKQFLVGQGSPRPVYQVIAGFRRKPDTVKLKVAHGGGCQGPKDYLPVVGSLKRAFQWETSLRVTDGTAKGAEVSFETRANNQAIATRGLKAILSRLNPLRWPKLVREEWVVRVIDAKLPSSVVYADGAPLEAAIQAYPDLRWEVSASISRGGGKKEGGTAQLDASQGKVDAQIHRDKDGDFKAKEIKKAGWSLIGKVQCTYDGYTFELDGPLLSSLQESLPFLSGFESLFDILKKVAELVPGGSAGINWPALTLSVAGAPYELSKAGLVGYKGEIQIKAAPLIGLKFELNILILILTVVPVTAPAVPILKALKQGIGVNGVARLQVDIGIYFIADGNIEVDWKWTIRTPEPLASAGLADASIALKIEGRATADFTAFIVSGGAGVQVGAKSAIGVCCKAARAQSEDRLALQGQMRWEGIVLYYILYAKVGMSVKPWGKKATVKGSGAEKKKEKSTVVCKPHYWPEAPKPHLVGGKKKEKKGSKPEDHPVTPLDPFRGKGEKGEEVPITNAQATELASSSAQASPAAKAKAKQKKKGLWARLFGKR